jgi:hypothetical protein
MKRRWEMGVDEGGANGRWFIHRERENVGVCLHGYNGDGERGREREGERKNIFFS